VLFAFGHTLGFRNTALKWGVDDLIRGMKSIRFDAQGFSRSYWDFYTGFGLFVSVFLLFTAVVAWQLGGLSPEEARPFSAIAWALAAAYIVAAFLSWRYFFFAPLLCSGAIAVLLVVGAWLHSVPPN
jgi:hypothetical protein